MGNKFEPVWGGGRPNFGGRVYIYIHNKYNTNGNHIIVHKDAHWFNVLFASPEMSVRVDFKG